MKAATRITDFNDLPGDIIYNEKRKADVYQFPNVKNITKTGKESFWKINVALCDLNGTTIKFPEDAYTKDFPPGGYTEIFVEGGQVGGKVREVKPTKITVGKNIGKKNETTVITQALSDAYSKWKSKEKKSVSEVPELPSHMLALDYHKITTFKSTDPYAYQYKYDGMRMAIIQNEDGSLYYYTRGREEIKPNSNLDPEIKELISKFPKGTILDGEIYLHGEILEDINGSARNLKSVHNDIKERLQFWCYDCILPGKTTIRESQYTFRERNDAINKAFEGTDFKLVYKSETTFLESAENFMDLHDKAIEEGYEGIILRDPEAFYEFGNNGYKSKKLVKVKKRIRDEYEIVGYRTGKGAYEGLVKFVCKTDSGEEFVVVPNISAESKRELYEKFESDQKYFEDEYKGKLYTVEYFKLSEKGIPLQNKGIALF